MNCAINIELCNKVVMTFLTPLSLEHQKEIFLQTGGEILYAGGIYSEEVRIQRPWVWPSVR